jgi:hypothetical protein
MDVIMINYSDSSFEVVNANDRENLFQNNIYETLLRTRKIWLYTNIPFIVHFCVEYELEYGKIKTDSIPKCKLKVIAYPTREWRDTSYIHNGYGIPYFPQVKGKPVYSSNWKLKHYHAIESLEDVMEAAVNHVVTKQFI